MRTHIDDDRLLEQALRLGRLGTKTAAVNAALAVYVKSLQRREILELRGKVEWKGSLDQMRAMRTRP